MLRHIRNLAIIFIILIGGAIWYLSRGDTARLPETALEGGAPQFTAERQELIPTMKIADPVGWKAGEQPVAAAGLSVTRFADGLDHPRRVYRLPNGDLLVAETNSQPREDKGITGAVMKKLIGWAGAGGKSPDRILLLRDTNGDGKADARSVFLSGLKSPYGMALVGSTLYVANTDALLAFPYHEGDTSISAKPIKIVDLPATAPNEHWTRNVVANKEGSLLYVAIGSNSNIADNGMEAEKNRAAIWEVDPAKKSFRIFADGMRNPIGMAWEPTSGELWAVVNERDMLGSDLPPDYLTRVEFGAFYGWPWFYWGGYEDFRISPRPGDKEEHGRPYNHRPDYGVGSHTAPLGLTFATGEKLGDAYANGAFVGLHGSWNRKPPAGYKVVFVPFDATGHPVKASKPSDVLTGFLTADGKKARGRPVDVAIDGSGALLVSDDVGGVIWRVARK